MSSGEHAAAELAPFVEARETAGDVDIEGWLEECGDAPPCALHVHRSAPSRLGEPARLLLAVRRGAAIAIGKACEVLREQYGPMNADHTGSLIAAAVREELGPPVPEESDDAPTLLSAGAPGEMAVTDGAFDDDATWPGERRP